MIGKAPPDLPPPPPDPPRRPRPPPPVGLAFCPVPPDDCAQLTLNPISRGKSLRERLNAQTPPSGEAAWAAGDAGSANADNAARHPNTTDTRMVVRSTVARSRIRKPFLGVVVRRAPFHRASTRGTCKFSRAC